MVIPDADSWIDLLNGHPAGDHLAKLVDEGQAVVVGSALAEVLRGIAGEPERQRVIGFLDRLDYAEMNRAVWIRAGEIASGLEAQGLRIPMSDIYIGALALDGDHEILTRDKHFERIPGLRLYDWKGDSDA